MKAFLTHFLGVPCRSAIALVNSIPAYIDLTVSITVTNGDKPTSPTAPLCKTQDAVESDQSASSDNRAAVPGVVQPAFAKFARLPREIRIMIWQAACEPFPRLHFLSFGSPPSSYGPLQDPADVDKYDQRLLQSMTALVNRFKDEASATGWGVPGCRRYRGFFWTSIPLKQVCPESRAVFDSMERELKSRGVRLKGNLLPPVDFDSAICCFRAAQGDKRNETPNLLTTRPQVSPTQIAIEVMDDQQTNFTLNEDRTEARQRLPRWLTKAMEWGRDEKEEEVSGVHTTVRPPQDALAIDLKNLKTVFVLSYGIQPKDDDGNLTKDLQKGRAPSQVYTKMVDGMESYFYGLDPNDDNVLKYWDIPDYVWLVRTEIQRLLESSEAWKVEVRLMAAASKKPLLSRSSSVLQAPKATTEITSMLG